MIRLNVFIQAEEGKHAEIVRLGKELVEKSLKDEGCIAYDLFNSETRKDILMICETWTNEAALSVHEKSDHFTTLVPKIQSLGKMKIEKFEF